MSVDPEGLAGEKSYYTGRYRIDKDDYTKTIPGNVPSTGDDWLWSIVTAIANRVTINKEGYRCNCEVKVLDYDLGMTCETRYIAGCPVTIPTGPSWIRDPDDDEYKWEAFGDIFRVHASWADVVRQGEKYSEIIGDNIGTLYAKAIWGDPPESDLAKAYVEMLGNEAGNQIGEWIKRKRRELSKKQDAETKWKTEKEFKLLTMKLECEKLCKGKAGRRAD